MKLYEFVEKIEAMGDIEAPKTIRSKKTLAEEGLNESLMLEASSDEMLDRFFELNAGVDPEELLQWILQNVITDEQLHEMIDYAEEIEHMHAQDDLDESLVEDDDDDLDESYTASDELFDESLTESLKPEDLVPGKVYRHKRSIPYMSKADAEEYPEDFEPVKELLVLFNNTYSLPGPNEITYVGSEAQAQDWNPILVFDVMGTKISFNRDILNYLEPVNEELTEARNPENEEVNAIIAKYLGKKSKISKKEQEVLDKYGISRNKYGDFVGPNGKELRSFGRKTVQGPEIPVSKYGSRGRQHWDWSANADFRSGKKDSFDAVDYANYLTKETPGEGEYPATNDNYYNRKKSSGRWDNEYPSTPSEDAALRPYSDKYQELKANVEDKKYDVENASGWRKPLTDDELEAKVAEYRDQLLKDQKRYQDWANSDKQAYDAAKQELDDFKASVPKRNK
jgi:hypothetical protein